ncbi:MAG: hypothetical protein ABEJ46_05290 [Gemmatimonadota bacterium]
MLVAALWIGPAGQRDGVGQQQDARVDTASLASGPYAEMCMLLEKTLFQVNVLTVRIRFGPETAARLRALAQSSEPSGALRDSIVSTALRARDALVRAGFLRGVGLDRFIEETRKNLRRARDAGIITGVAFRRISESLPEWYDFLEERGIREGDEIVYRIRGDTLRSLYRLRDGSLPLDLTETGRQRRLAVLGSYLAPGSEFRRPLIRSLLRGKERRCPPGPGTAE